MKDLGRRDLGVDVIDAMMADPAHRTWRDGYLLTCRDIVCVADLERVHPQPKRAHQGWRYLAHADAPKGVDDQSGVGELPPELYRELAGLMLI